MPFKLIHSNQETRRALGNARKQFFNSAGADQRYSSFKLYWVFNLGLGIEILRFEPFSPFSPAMSPSMASLAL
jgi:hypothetical protein